MREKHTTN